MKVSDIYPPATLLSMRNEIAEDALQSTKKIATIRKMLSDEEQNLTKLNAALDCAHDFEDGKYDRLMLNEPTCTKCGYTWTY